MPSFLIAGQRSNHVSLGGGTLKTLTRVGVGHRGVMMQVCCWTETGIDVEAQLAELNGKSERTTGVFSRRLPPSATGK